MMLPDRSCLQSALKLSTLALVLAVQIGAASAQPSPPVSVDYGLGVDIFFGRREIGITAASREKLLMLADRAVAGFPTKPCVALDGNADTSEGNKLEQKRLSQLRVQRVAELLERHGNGSIKIVIAESFGASQPVAKPPNLKNAHVGVSFKPCWKHDL